VGGSQREGATLEHDTLILTLSHQGRGELFPVLMKIWSWSRLARSTWEAMT